MPIDIDECVAEILDLGHCILPGHFPRTALEECRQAFEPLLEDVAARIPEGNRGPNRWAIGLPFAPPFYHSAFFNDDTVIEIVSRILGRGHATSPTTARTHRYRDQNISTSTQICLSVQRGTCTSPSTRPAVRAVYVRRYDAGEWTLEVAEAYAASAPD